MTVLIGMLCKDGVVIGSDSVATMGAANYSTIEHEGVKKVQIYNSTILACTGGVGLAQRMGKIVNDRNPTLDKGMSSINYVEDIANQVIKNMQKTYYLDSPTVRHRGSYEFGALLATITKEGPLLVEFDPTNFQPEIKNKDIWYVSMCSGQQIADTLLEFLKKIFWNDHQPKVNEASFFIKWILLILNDLNTGGIGGPAQIATLSKNSEGTWIFTDVKDGETIDSVRELEKNLRISWLNYWDSTHKEPDIGLPTKQ